MEKLSNFIKGLQIIENTEPNINAFSAPYGTFFIGAIHSYSDDLISELDALGFSLNEEYECFEYNID